MCSGLYVLCAHYTLPWEVWLFQCQSGKYYVGSKSVLRRSFRARLYKIIIISCHFVFSCQIKRDFINKIRPICQPKSKLIGEKSFDVCYEGGTLKQNPFELNACYFISNFFFFPLFCKLNNAILEQRRIENSKLRFSEISFYFFFCLWKCHRNA